MNRVYYMLAFVVVGYASILYDAMYLRAFFAVLVFLPLILYIMIRYQKKYLKVTLYSGEPIARKRTPFQVQVVAENESKIPVSRLDVRLSFAYDVASEYGSVKLRGMADNEAATYINYTVTSEFCGRLSIEAASLRIYDVFGITFCRLAKAEAVTVVIMPEIYDLDIQVRESTRAFPVSSDDYDPHKSGDDVSEIFDLREYRGGDRVSQIHWKLSARTEELIVKEFSHPVGCSVLFLLDFSFQGVDMPKVSMIDNFIEIAASISSGMLNASCFHYVSWYSSTQGTLIRRSIKSQEDLSEMLAELLLAEPYEETFSLSGLYHDTYISDAFSSQLLLDIQLRLQTNDDNRIQFLPGRLSHSLAAADIVV